MRAFGRAVMVRVPMCLSRVLFEVVSTIGTYDMVVPMNTPMLQPRDVREFITQSGRIFF